MSRPVQRPSYADVVKCGQCGAEVRVGAMYCVMCGALVTGQRAPESPTRHGLSGTAIVVVIAAAMMGLVLIAGIIMLVRSFVS